MMHFDTGPRAPIYTHSATVIKMAPAIKSQYSGSPETYIHVLADVDFDGDRRLMRFKAEANRFLALPLMKVGETMSLGAHSFKGDEVYLQELAPSWPGLWVADPRDEKEASKEITARAVIVHRAEAIYSSHQHPESVLHFRVDLPDALGQNRAAYFTVEASRHIDAPLALTGYPVEITFTDSTYYPGKLWIKSFRVDWAAVLKAEGQVPPPR